MLDLKHLSGTELNGTGLGVEWNWTGDRMELDWGRNGTGLGKE